MALKDKLAKIDCSICGTSTGALSGRVKTKDDHTLCKDCANRASEEFPFRHYTLEEYYTNINQRLEGYCGIDKAAEGREIYETLLKDRINIKQIDPPGFILRFLARKNIDDTIKRYGQNRLGVWAIEEYGLILIRDEAKASLFLKDEDALYYVYRYSELSSYCMNAVSNSDDDDNNSVSLYIELAFNGGVIPDVRHVGIALSSVYKKFNQYFGQIVGGDMTEYDRRADAFLAGMAAKY